MFKKCLKYDMQSFRKIWLIAAAVVLVVALVSGIGISGFVIAISDIEQAAESNEPGFVEALWIFARMIIAMVCYFAFLSTMTIFMSGSTILRYVRYYTHFFTDQGYLTFTLPVKRSTQFWSKAVSGLIYTLASMLVSLLAFLIVGVCILIGILFDPYASATMLPSLFEELALISFPDVLYVLGLVVLSVVLSVALQFAALMGEYLIITIGATLFRKLKLLSVIATYYVINNVLAIMPSFFGVYYFIFAMMFLSMGLIPLFTVPLLGWLGIYLLLIFASVLLLAIGFVFAFFSIQRLERKLNLA